MKTLTPNDVGTLFNLLSPENRDMFFDLLKDLAEHEAKSPDAPDQESQKSRITSEVRSSCWTGVSFSSSSGSLSIGTSSPISHASDTLRAMDRMDSFHCPGSTLPLTNWLISDLPSLIRYLAQYGLCHGGYIRLFQVSLFHNESQSLSSGLSLHVSTSVSFRYSITRHEHKFKLYLEHFYLNFEFFY